MTDNRKSTITAKVAAQIVEYYRQALKNFETQGISDIITSRRLKVNQERYYCNSSQDEVIFIPFY